MQLKLHTFFIFFGIIFLAFPATAEQRYPGRPTNKELLLWMQRPCLETLQGVRHIMINDASFEREVIKTKDAVLVLFITDAPVGTEKNASRGMTALARAIKSVHPRLKLAVWLVNADGFVSTTEFTPLQKKYGLRNVPCIRFYDDRERLGYNQMRTTEVDSGIIWDGELLLQVDHFAREYVPETIFSK